MNEWLRKGGRDVELQDAMEEEDGAGSKQIG
jgi:hypothetical protein